MNTLIIAKMSKVTYDDWKIKFRLFCKCELYLSKVIFKINFQKANIYRKILQILYVKISRHI